MRFLNLLLEYYLILSFEMSKDIADDNIDDDDDDQVDIDECSLLVVYDI